jgi:glycosyltransferase involved in cell wall biosynthesis
LEAGEDVLVITGEGELDIPGLAQSRAEELRYDRDWNIPLENSPEELQKRAQKLADAITRIMQAHWGAEADILHIHNPLIRKNAALLPALHILQERGLKLLLQNHDLAEDFRPDVYVGNEEYPINCHYAVINSRDYSFLRRAGLDTKGLHLLPNEVRPVRASPGLERKRYLYPVRAIRRKNIGEALLLSLFIPKGRTVAITLPPTLEKDLLIYRAWMDLARELELPVEFQVGQDSPLEDIYGSALGVLTTSVKEGFGFSFLEPWTAGRMVIGRRISYVCRDFENAGVRFNALYATLNIPTVYISAVILKQKLKQTMITIYEAFGIKPPRYILKMLEDDILFKEVMDFGRMDEKSQAGIIRLLVSNQAVFRDISEANPFLQELKDWQPDEDLIESNRIKVLESYGKEAILSILRETYRATMDTPVTHRISKSILLELFMYPLRLSLVGVGHG